MGRDYLQEHKTRHKDTPIHLGVTAPEVAINQAFSYMSDIFALGAAFKQIMGGTSDYTGTLLHTYLKEVLLLYEEESWQHYLYRHQYETKVLYYYL